MLNLKNIIENVEGQNIEGNRVPWRSRDVNVYFDLKSGDFDLNWGVYKKFLMLQSYFVGLFENKTDDEIFEEIETDFFKWLWLNGEIFVTFFNGGLQIWNITKKFTDGCHVKKVECNLITKDLEIHHKNYTNYTTFENGVNGIYLQWNNVVMPSIVLWWDYLCTIWRLEQQFLKNTIWDSKKFIYTINNDDVHISKMEQDSLSDPFSPFIKNVSPTSIIGKGGIIQNIFTHLDTGSSKSDQAYNNLLNYQNYVFNQMGVMSPINNKKERKTMSESSLDVYNTVNIENITLRQLKRFAKKAKKLWGLNLDFERVTNFLDIKGDERFREGEEENEKI